MDTSRWRDSARRDAELRTKTDSHLYSSFRKAIAPSLIMAPYLSTKGRPTSLPVGSPLREKNVYVVKANAKTPLRGGWRHVAATRCDRVSLRRAAGPHSHDTCCAWRAAAVPRPGDGGWHARIAPPPRPQASTFRRAPAAARAPAVL